MTLSTLLRYLIGGRQAILDIARSRRAVWLGLLFVLSAGLAREYDGEDLLHEPWYLLLPLGASLVTSLLLFCLVFGIARLRGVRDAAFVPTYRSFLGLYWMTAPLAWLYAIPFERFLSPATATRTNLCVLGLVALWRVCLMVRVISVLFQTNWLASFFKVMLFSDVVALFMLCLTPIPVLSIMGGIRLTESEQLIRGTANAIGFAGSLSLLVWIVGCAVVARGRASWKLAELSSGQDQGVSRGLWSVAAVSVVGWTMVLPFTQPEQQLRHSVEDHLRNGRIKQAVREMSAHARGDFPPHWDPPARPGYGEYEPSLTDVLEVMVSEKVPLWVFSLYAGKLKQHLEGGLSFRRLSLDRMDDKELSHFASLLQHLPEGPEIAAIFRETVEMRLEYDTKISTSRRESLEAILRLANSKSTH